MNRFSIAPEAMADLDGIWDYIGIRNDNPNAAYRQLQMLYEKFSFLAKQPLMGERREDLGTNLRSFVARNYVVVYRPLSEEIEIIRVVHSARDIHALFRR